MKELWDKYLNKRGSIVVGALTFDVVVKNVKISYGNLRFLVTPVMGRGEAWVEKVTLDEEIYEQSI